VFDCFGGSELGWNFSIGLSYTLEAYQDRDMSYQAPFKFVPAGTHEIYEPEYSGPEPLVISHSSRGTFRGCAERFNFSKMYKHAVRGESLKPFLGGVLHDAFGVYLKTGDTEAASWELFRRYPSPAVQASFEGKPVDFYDPFQNTGLEACYLALQTLMRSPRLLQYTGAVDVIRATDGQKVPAIEIEFDLVLEGVFVSGRPVIFTGFIDYVFFNSLKGTYAVIDLKNTWDWDLDVIAKYQFNGQCVPYGIVLQHLLDLPLKEFQIQYLHTVVDLVSPSVTPYDFDIGEAEVSDWFMGLCEDVQLMQRYAEMGWWRKTEHGGCKSWGRTCPYFKVCGIRDPATRQNMLLHATQEAAPPRERQPIVVIKLDMPGYLKSKAKGDTK